VGRFLLFLTGDWFSPLLAFDAQGHKVVIHPKTVTIVMMSAAQEQKKATPTFTNFIPLAEHTRRRVQGRVKVACSSDG